MGPDVVDLKALDASAGLALSAGLLPDIAFHLSGDVATHFRRRFRGAQCFRRDLSLRLFRRVEFFERGLGDESEEFSHREIRMLVSQETFELLEIFQRLVRQKALEL